MVLKTLDEHVKIAYTKFVDKIEKKYGPIEDLIDERKKEVKDLFQELREKIPDIKTSDLSDFFSKLDRWGLNFVTVIQHINKNDSEEIRKILGEFIKKDELTPKDFDRLKTLKGFSIGAASAFFSLKKPDKFTFFGPSIIDAMKKLSFDIKYGDSGEDYFNVNEELLLFANKYDVPLALIDWFLSDLGIDNDITNYSIDEKSNILIYKKDIEDAFRITKSSDFKGKPGYDPYHMIVIEDEDKPVKAVFRNIKSVPNNHSFTTNSAERVFIKLGFKLKTISDTGLPSQKFKIFLAPRSNERSYKNFKSTIEDGVPYERIKNHLDEEGKEVLKNQQKILAWGNLPGKKASWEFMNKGDYVFFYVKGKFPYVGRLLYKTFNKDLSIALWPPKSKSEPWSYIFFLEDFKKLDPPIDITEFRNLAEYSDGWIVQGFQPLNETGLNAIHKQYGSIDEFIKKRIPTTAQIQPIMINNWNLQVGDFDNLRIKHDRIENNKKMICAALNSNKHIILIGAPGTGKTEIAKYIGEISQSESRKFCKGYILTTATSDWSTFDTIGGLIPNTNNGGSLEFKRGKFLESIADNKILIIDEINRADIDKAFGQLFTILSGQSVELQYEEDGHPIKIIRDRTRNESGYNNGIYRVGNNWRIIATMNTFDKTSLYEMSYAFMRRFAFIHVGVPEDERVLDALIKQFDLGKKINVEYTEKIHGLWLEINTLRKIGPAVIKDIIEHLSTINEIDLAALNDAIIAYMLPQFEGMEKQNQIRLFKIIMRYIDDDKIIDETRKMFVEMFELDSDSLV